MRNLRKGFTLVEVIISLALIVIVVGIIGYLGVFCLVCKGNFHVYTDTQALKAIQVDNPEYVKVINIERHAVAYTKVTAEDGSGTRADFLLDTNIFQNRKVVTEEIE